VASALALPDATLGCRVLFAQLALAQAGPDRGEPIEIADVTTPPTTPGCLAPVGLTRPALLGP
jgi:hypothetical protein